VRAIAKEMEAQIREVLTPAQQAAYDTNIVRMREEFRKHEHGHRGGPPKE